MSDLICIVFIGCFIELIRFSDKYLHWKQCGPDNALHVYCAVSGTDRHYYHGAFFILYLLLTEIFFSLE